MNVTITGNLGAGKTSVCNELKKMGYDVISGGDIYRTYAQEHGITIVELNEMAKTDRSVDIQIDERTEKLTPREVAKEIDQLVKRIEHAKIWVQNDLEDMEEER